MTRHDLKFLPFLSVIILGLLSACTEDNPFAEFTQKMEDNEPIPPKKYSGDEWGYVFYQKRYGSEDISKWLLTLNPDLYFSSDGFSKDDTLETTISPNSTLRLLFNVNELRPLWRSEVEALPPKKAESSPNFTAVVSSLRVEYATKDKYSKRNNQLPDNLLIRDNCIMGGERAHGLYKLVPKNGNQRCHHSSNRNNFFLISDADNFHARVDCGEEEKDYCNIYANLDLNRKFELYLKKRHFKNIHQIVHEVYSFLNSSTLAIDETVLRRK